MNASRMCHQHFARFRSCLGKGEEGDVPLRARSRVPAGPKSSSRWVPGTGRFQNSDKPFDAVDSVVANRFSQNDRH